MNDTSRTYDVVVLGAGPVGENVADRARAAGLSTVIVESQLVGGECSYWACMPSKALLRPVLARADARRLPSLREAVVGPPDAGAVLARRDEFTSHWHDDGQAGWLASAEVDLVRGHGRLDGPRQVAVATADRGTVRLTARHAVAVCTGTTASLPDLPGIGTVRPWTSRDATSARKVPGRLAVVGGGVVAAEMATAWQALGARVTLLVRGDGLLPRMEPFAGELVTGALRDAGADVRFGVSVTSVSRMGGPGAGEGEPTKEGRRGPAGPVRAVLDDGGELTADEILFATGRDPATRDIGLESVGLTPGDWLEVDDTCRVGGIEGGWLYAAGDVNHRALLTHQGKYQGRVAGAVIGARAKGEPVDDGRWGAHAATADHAAVPQVVFTDPEVASVGLTEREAREAGLRTRTVDYDLADVAGASLYADGYRGRARMLVDLDRGTLAGVTFAGPGVGELIHSATVAVVGEVPLARLWHAVPSYPTISEIWLRLLETFRG